MVRISHILRKGQEEHPDRPGVHLSQIVTEALEGTDLEEFYRETLAVVRDFYEKIKTGHQDVTGIVKQAERLVDSVALGGERLLSIAVSKDPAEFLFSHIVNVAILSVMVGLQSGLNKSSLSRLATGALLHDIGMMEVLDLVRIPRRLTEKESERIKEHPIRGAEMARKIPDLHPSVSEIILQGHERVDGSGYPRGLRDGGIDPLAKVIRVADTFDALIHTRPYRKKFLVPEALREMLGEKQAYDQGVLKHFIATVGVYPVGSWVELSTEEIARVTRMNPGLLFRPQVAVIFTREGKKQEQTRVIDLALETGISITRVLDDSQIEKFLTREEG